MHRVRLCLRHFQEFVQANRIHVVGNIEAPNRFSMNCHAIILISSMPSSFTAKLTKAFKFGFDEKHFFKFWLNCCGSFWLWATRSQRKASQLEIPCLFSECIRFSWQQFIITSTVRKCIYHRWISCIHPSLEAVVFPPKNKTKDWAMATSVISLRNVKKRAIISCEAINATLEFNAKWMNSNANGIYSTTFRLAPIYCLCIVHSRCFT